jgi:hypothetical protein
MPQECRSSEIRNRPQNVHYLQNNVGTEFPPLSADISVPIQRGPKVTFLVAHSSRGRCTQHSHDVRGLHDAHRTRILRQIHTGFTPEAHHSREFDAQQVILLLDLCSINILPIFLPRVIIRIVIHTDVSKKMLKPFGPAPLD